MKAYRDRGAIGALLDEYERVILDLIETIASLTELQLSTVVDAETKDEDCRSVQTILTHVLGAGYYYSFAIGKHLGQAVTATDRVTYSAVADYSRDLHHLMSYTESIFANISNELLQEKGSQKKILASWGQRYDIEQLMEHAIVHILRHRRQIERFQLSL